MASVLFVDLVSYTTLSESRDSEEVRELLAEYFDMCSTIVRRYGGTVEKFIGDAVMAVWGVPTAHEDDAERSVRAGLEVVTAISDLGERLGLPELAARAGVVTGEVATNLAAVNQGLVAGDAVNTASRVQAAAGAGEVWVDDVTRKLTAAAVSYDDEGLHALKGKGDRVHLFRAGAVVAAIGGQQRVDGLEAPLVGRDRELRLLKELFHATEESGRPRLVVLDGEAGSGKSRLGWEFEKYIDGLKTQVSWHRGRCLSYGEGVAFWALAEAIRARVGVVEDEPGQVVIDALDRQLLQSVADDEERSWIRPRVASLLGEESGDFDRQDLFAAWQRFLERVAQGNPLVFLVDDAQHADDGLLDFVESLLASSHSSIFVLMLARPELLESHPQLGGRRASIIRLEPLPDAAMTRLVDDLVAGMPARVRDELAKRSEGVPLFAVETVRALIDRELVIPSGGRYVVNPDHAIDLAEVGAPASLHALVAARLDALPADERRVLSDASVLGECFTRTDIGILAADVRELDGLLARLQRKELVTTDVDRFSAERGQFRFVQSVVRYVAYSTLSKRDRKARHLLIAENLSSQAERQPELGLVAAQHLFDAIDASPADDPDVPGLTARAAGLLVRAGDRATRLGAHTDALRAYQTAADRLVDPRERADALAKAAQSALDVGRLGDCVELASQAETELAALGDAVEAARAGAVLAHAHLMRGELATSLEVAKRAYARADGDEAALGIRADAAATLGRATLNSGGDDALTWLGQALRLAEAAGDERALLRAMMQLATFAQGQWSIWAGEALNRQVVEIARSRELWSILAGGLVNSALIARLRHLPESTRMLEEGIGTAREHGLDRASFSVNLAPTLWAHGRWADLDQLFLDVNEEWPELSVGDQVMFEAVAGWCRRAGRELDLPAVEETFSDDLNWRSWDAHLRAMSAAASGDQAAAGRAGSRCLELALEDAGIADDYIVQVPRMVRVAVECEQYDVAATMVARLAEAPSTSAVAGLHAYARAFRGLVGARTGAPAESVEADLRAGIEMLEEYGAVPDRALAQEDLGRWLIEQGRAEEAEPHLQAARRTYADLGAPSWLARLDSLVPSAGGLAR